MVKIVQIVKILFNFGTRLADEILPIVGQYPLVSPLLYFHVPLESDLQVFGRVLRKPSRILLFLHESVCTENA